MKHRLRNSIIILLVTGIMLFLLLKDNFNSIMEVLTKVNPIWIIFAIAIYVIYFIIDTIPFYIYCHNYNNKIKFSFMIYLNTITKFFNGITPLASGGQPFQVYLLHKEKVKMSDAVSIITQIYILFVLSVVLYAIMGFVYSGITHLIALDGIILAMVLFGIIIYICIL